MIWWYVVMGYKRGCTCGFCCVGSFLPQCSLLFGPLRENRRLRMPSSCSRLWHSAQMTYPQCCTRTHPRLTAGFCIDSTPISDDRAAGTASARKNPFVGGSPASDPVLCSWLLCGFPSFLEGVAKILPLFFHVIDWNETSPKPMCLGESKCLIFTFTRLNVHLLPSWHSESSPLIAACPVGHGCNVPQVSFFETSSISTMQLATVHCTTNLRGVSNPRLPLWWLWCVSWRN